MSLVSSAGKLGSKLGGGIKSLTSSKAGKAALTGAGIGGGSYVALTAAGAGAENFLEGTGLGGIVKLVNPSADKDGSRGVGTLIGIGLLVGIALLLVFVILPKGRKNRGGSNA